MEGLKWVILLVLLECGHMFSLKSSLNKRSSSAVSMTTDELFGMSNSTFDNFNFTPPNSATIHDFVVQENSALSCSLYTNTARQIIISRHHGHVRTHFHSGHSYNRRSKRVVTVNSAPHCQPSITQNANLDCSLELKCKIMEFFDNSGSTRTITLSQGDLKWSDIAVTLRDHVSPLLINCGGVIDFQSIYDDIACMVTSNPIDDNTSTDKKIKKAWQGHVSIIGEIHRQFYEVQHNISNIDCFDEMLGILEDISEIMEVITAADPHIGCRGGYYNILHDADCLERTLDLLDDSTQRSKYLTDNKATCAIQAVIKLSEIHETVSTRLDDMDVDSGPLHNLKQYYEPLCSVFVKYFIANYPILKTTYNITTSRIIGKCGSTTDWNRFFLHKKRKITNTSG